MNSPVTRREPTAMKLTVDYKHVVADRDRHGNTRYYLRQPGQPKIRIRATPDTGDFDAAVAAARASAQEQSPSGQPGQPRPGTLRALGRAYFASADFRRLDPRSQRNRINILESCFDEPLKPGAPDMMGECPLHLFGPRHLRVMRDRKAELPGAANNRLKYMSSLFGWAIEEGRANANPVRDVKRISYASEGYHTWTVEEILQFFARHPPGSKPRLAIALLLFTGARRGDAVRMGRQHLRNGWLTFTPAKTRKIKSEPVQIPLLKPLAAEIDAAPRKGMTFLLTEQGRPFTAAGFGGWFKDRCREAGLPHCSSHGLRKGGAALAAQNGATSEQLKAIFGWSDSRQADDYTRRANRRVMTQGLEQLLDFPGAKGAA